MGEVTSPRTHDVGKTNYATRVAAPHEHDSLHYA